MKRITFLLAGLMILFAGNIFAQPMGGPGHQGKKRDKVEKRVTEMRIWKLTEALELKTEQADKFFPRYREYLEENHENHKQLRRTLEDMRDGARRGDDDKEILALMKKHQELEKNRLTIEEKLLKDVESTLTVSQRARLIIFERMFQQRLRDIVHDFRDIPPPMPGQQGGPHGR